MRRVRGAPPSREAEFTEFVEASSARLLRAALVLLDTREEAEDALQLALLRTFRRWDHAQQAPEAYSRTVLVNVCRERWRYRARHPEVKGVPADTSPQSVVASFTEAVDRRHVLVRLLRRLPAVQREVLVFRYMLDASVADTAAALDIAEGLDDVTPRAGLAGSVIARSRKGRRRRFAGVVGLFVVFAGIGVPVGIASTSDGARSGPVSLRLGSYTLTLPDRYHLSDAKTAPCAAGTGSRQEAAAVASGVCVLMFFMPPTVPGQASRGVPRGAREVTLGRYRAWLAPSGYAPSGDGPAPVPTALVIEGEGQDLVIGASGLSRSALVSLVSSGLSAA